jgi:hypothetical protein
VALRGQNHCFAHSRRNRRALQPPVPLVPKRKNRALTAFLISQMPHTLEGSE